MVSMLDSPPHTPDIVAASPPDSGKVRLLSLADLDQRTSAARSAKALISELHDDLGGEHHLSAAERALTVRAAICTAMLEHIETVWLSGRGLDVAAYTALVNVQRRTLTTLGLKRVPRDITPTLDRYLASKATAPAEGVS
jgi:hypothetical protein